MQFTGLTQQGVLLREDIDARVARVLSHGQFIMGPEVSEVESALATRCGAKHCISVANGTDALQIVLMSWGIGAGDAIFLPSFTYTATAEAILILGAVPIFVDIEENTFNISVASIAEAIVEAKRKHLHPRVVIAVDLFGLPANYEALKLFADEHDLQLLSDAAQSFGAITASNAAVGKLAPVTTTSFFPAKPLGCYGDGGAIFTDDDELATVMRSIRVHGQGREKYETVRIGMNSRLDTIQAAVLLAKLSVFTQEIANRNRLADYYSSRLASLVDIPEKPAGVTSAWAQYTIRVADRDRVQKRLKDQQVPTAIYYPKPMHLQQAYMNYGEGPGSLPISERVSKEVLSLPMNAYYEEFEASAVCEAVAEAIS